VKVPKLLDITIKVDGHDQPNERDYSGGITA